MDWIFLLLLAIPVLFSWWMVRKIYLIRGEMDKTKV